LGDDGYSAKNGTLTADYTYNSTNTTTEKGRHSEEHEDGSVIQRRLREVTTTGTHVHQEESSSYRDTAEGRELSGGSATTVTTNVSEYDEDTYNYSTEYWAGVDDYKVLSQHTVIDFNDTVTQTTSLTYDSSDSRATTSDETISRHQNTYQGYIYFPSTSFFEPGPSEHYSNSETVQRSHSGKGVDQPYDDVTQRNWGRYNKADPNNGSTFYPDYKDYYIPDGSKWITCEYTYFAGYEPYLKSYNFEYATDNNDPDPQPKVTAPGGKVTPGTLEAGLSVANSLLDVLDTRSAVVADIDRLQNLLDHGYTGGGRARMTLDRDKIERELHGQQLRLNALNNDAALFVGKLNSGFADTVVPDYGYWTRGESPALEPGGVGPQAVLQRAIFLTYADLRGPAGLSSVMGPEMILGAGFAGFLGSGARAGIEAAIDEAVGAPVSWLKGRFTKPAVTKVDDGPTVSVFHKGELDNGRVSPYRELSTRIDRASVEALGRAGQIHQFDIPENVLRDWESSGLARRLLDFDNVTGVINTEWRFSPSLADQLNGYLIP
jgi:hypothetical protein